MPLVYAAQVNFNHQKGHTSCPQKIGAISIGAQSKERSKLTALEFTGNLGPLLSFKPLAPSGEGVRITLMGTLSCEKLEAGSYSGTIEVTLTGLSSGNTGHASIPIAGTVQ